MLCHRDRRMTKPVARRPLRPTGYDGMGPSAALALLDRWRASTSSCRLAASPMALVTRPYRLPPRAPRKASAGSPPPCRLSWTTDGLPGVITMIARGGAIVHWEAVGMRDIEAGDPLEPDDIFRIYSMTKPITSTANHDACRERRHRSRPEQPLAQNLAFSGVDEPVVVFCCVSA